MTVPRHDRPEEPGLALGSRSPSGHQWQPSWGDDLRKTIPFLKKDIEGWRIRI
jgi:hypothetical protein